MERGGLSVISALIRPCARVISRYLTLARVPYIMDSLASKDKPAASRSKDENKENASKALKDPSTPPRKAPAARDKLKPLAMPKALKI